jgi:hypothetical protein
VFSSLPPLDLDLDESDRRKKENICIASERLVLAMSPLHQVTSMKGVARVLAIASLCWCGHGQPRDSFKEDFGKGIGSECLIEMHNAVYDDHAWKLLQIFREDTEKKCDINEIIPDGSGQTLIMNAVLTGKSDELITALLDNGADVSIGEHDGFTPIHGAGFQGRASAVKILVEHPKAKMDVNDKHRDGHAPLHRACWGMEQRHTDTVKMLIEYGADALEPFCRKSRGPDGKIREKCQELVDMTRNQETRKVLEAHSKKTSGEAIEL